MKTNDLVTISSVALCTATLTVLTFWSGSLDAGNEGAVLTPKIVQPKLVAQGVELTLTAAEGRTFKAGDEPAFELKAINTTDEPATVAIDVAMTGVSPADALSRVIRLPSALWQQPQTLALKPNETRLITLSTQTKLPANQLISVSLHAPRSPLPAPPSHLNLPLAPAGIVALTFSTATAKSEPSPALAD